MVTIASPYRTTIITASLRILIFLLLAVFMAAPSFAQQPMRRETEDTPEPSHAPKKPELPGPRAIAVLEWTAKGPRLVPVAIKVDNQFYDASLYLAQPVPMAIDSGVIYQVEKAGDSLGDFTLNSSEQTPNGLWVGLGTYDSKEAQDNRKKKAAKREAAATAANAAEEKTEEGDRPVLRRSPKAGAPPAETPKQPDQKTQTQTSSSPTSGSSTTTTQTANQTPAPPSKPQLTETESDPDRPILRRGGPQEKPSPLTENASEKKSVPTSTGAANLEVAVSDASPKQAHPYKWTWKDSSEEQKLKAQAEKLAATILADYAEKTGGPKPGELQNVSFQTYDLSFSNAPTVIVSARVLPAAKPVAHRGAKTAKSPEPAGATPDFEYYVTVVGREDIYGQMQKEFAMPSDNKHLDAFPRLKLVDIVDADGNGVGDFLFQSTSDRGDSFVIYRDMGWSLEEVIKVPEPKV